MKKDTTSKAQAGAQATQGKADSKRKGKAEATAEAGQQATQQAETSQPTAQADKPTADSKADSKADKPAGRAEVEAAALAMVGEVKSHTGGRINLDSVRICPRKAGKVKAFLRPTYETPAGVTLTPYTAGGFAGFVLCDLTTEAGRQTLAALIGAKHKPTAKDKKAASKAEADKASKGKADSKPASKGKGKAQGKPTGQQATQQASKGKGQAGKASKPTAGKGKAGQQAGKADSKATA